jgi:hypothetical protein
MSIFKGRSKNSYIQELEADEKWKERENFIAPDDTITFKVYCYMCKKYHAIGVVAGRRLNKRHLEISIFTKINSNDCPNMIKEKDRNPINMNFL